MQKIILEIRRHNLNKDLNRRLGDENETNYREVTDLKSCLESTITIFQVEIGKLNIVWDGQESVIKTLMIKNLS